MCNIAILFGSRIAGHLLVSDLRRLCKIWFFDVVTIVGVRPKAIRGL